MQRLVRTITIIWTVCFLIGASSHAWDIWIGGWLPYGFMPLPFNVFWTALLPLDLSTALLLWIRRRLAVVFALTIMMVDVAVNGYTFFIAGIEQMQVGLLFQSGFLVFVLLTAPILWRSSDRERNLGTQK